MPVFSKKKSDKLRVYCLVGTEVSAKETADEISVYGSIVTREMYVFEIAAEAFEIGSQPFYLSGLSCAVQAFQYYQHDVFVLVMTYKYS